MDLPADPLADRTRREHPGRSDSARAHLSLVTSVPPSDAHALTVNAGTVNAPPANAPPLPLLPRIAAGDELAVRECVARYGPLIWALVRRWSPDLRDAEDAVQDVFVDLWRSASRYDVQRATEAGFVAMITRRRLIDRLRRRQRAIEFEPLADDFDVAREEDGDVDRELRVERAHDALRALPAAQRTMLELSLLHGRTHDEIARETNTPLGTVKSHIRRGLQRARDLLSASGRGADASLSREDES